MGEPFVIEDAITSTKYMDKETLLSDDTFLALDKMDDLEIQRYRIALADRAKQLGCVRDFNSIFKVFLDDLKRFRKEVSINERIKNSTFELKRDGKGVPLQTIDNFLLVINNDPIFKSLKFNELSYSPEHEINGELVRWSDADDSHAKNYLEKHYDLYHLQKYDDAMRIKFKQNSYHPIKLLIESVQWDGVERIAGFLTKWTRCEDTPYTREVSRLIFAGGINRLYRPGCKFDDMPVLIGTKQGEGKSTFVRWLALRDEFFREVSEIEGQRGIEAIEGGWICEMSELLALTKAKEVEAVKSYITKLVDTYRRPFDRRVTEHKRQCIFIGTTNKEQFLTDKTGNRRYYPVKVNQSGYDLFDKEDEIKADIIQCWAEAKAKFDQDDMKPFANRKLQREIQAMQKKAVEEDYRVDLIEDYLSNKFETCVLELWWRALNNPDWSKPSRKESNEIVLILQSTGEWESLEKPKRTQFGLVKCWVRGGNEKASNTQGDEKMLVSDNPFLI